MEHVNLLYLPLILNNLVYLPLSLNYLVFAVECVASRLFNLHNFVVFF